MHIAQGVMQIGETWTLDWGAKPQITRNEVIRNFRKKRFFTEQRMEDQKLEVWFGTKPGFANKIEPKVKKFYKYIKIGRRGYQISATQTYHRMGLGADPHAPETMRVV